MVFAVARVKLELAYDGTDFHGFAKQSGLRTVQGVLEETISQVVGAPIEVFGSGRTDKGVHARAQVVHWDQVQGPTTDRYPYVLRRILPSDIVATSAEVVDPSFHARFSAVGKTYRYTIQTARVEDVFTNRFAWHIPRHIDWDAVQSCFPILMGTHDFTSFCAAQTAVQDKVRTIHNLSMVERGTYVDIYCSGTGFLQYMVRIIVGTLVDVGLHQMRPQDVKTALDAQDRKQAGQTAPPHGLALWRVHYESRATDGSEIFE